MQSLNYDRIFPSDWNQPYQAKWAPKLDPNRGGVSEKLLRTIHRMVVWIPNLFVALCFNPRKETSYDEHRGSQGNTYFFNKKIVTPDEVSLSATISFREKKKNTAETVILFNPLITNNHFYQSLIDYLLNKDCQVITFDYRGYGNTRRAEDFVIDGESIYQYVKESLNISPEHIHFYGHSFGGAIATQVKMLHPDSGKLVADRTFKSLYSLIVEKGAELGNRWGVVARMIAVCVSKIFFAIPLCTLLGWEWDGSKYISNDKMVINNHIFPPYRWHSKRIWEMRDLFLVHTQDELVPFCANLADYKDRKEQVALENGCHFSPIGYLAATYKSDHPFQDHKFENAGEFLATFFSGKNDCK